jgi:organic hydroperoxide reductase OsmC/OhrA
VKNFEQGRYSGSIIGVDGGMKIAASSSPAVVPLPMSDASLIDPEEAFLASLSSCHMLFFLSISAKKNLIVRKIRRRCGGNDGQK